MTWWIKDRWDKKKLAASLSQWLITANNPHYKNALVKLSSTCKQGQVTLSVNWILKPWRFTLKFMMSPNLKSLAQQETEKPMRMCIGLRGEQCSHKQHLWIRFQIVIVHLCVSVHGFITIIAEHRGLKSVHFLNRYILQLISITLEDIVDKLLEILC